MKPQDLLDAAAQARTARDAWTRESNALVDLRDVERRQVSDVVQIRIEGGSRYLQGPLEDERRNILELAATRAARLPEEPEKRLAAVAWPAGPDLHATIYFNQREHPTRSPESLDPERLRAALEDRLRIEIERAASEVDRTARHRSEALGDVEARLPERETSRARPAPLPESRTETDERDAANAIVIALDREFARSIEARTNGGAEDRAAILERLEAPQRDWSQERVVIVGLRIPTGAEQLERARLNDEEMARVIQRAIDRALDVQVLVPERLGWTANQLRSPQFQQRLLTGFRQELMNVGRTRLGPARQLVPSAVRSIATVRQVPQIIRQAEQDPERAARQLARAVFEKLTDALPKPFRVARDLARTVSRFVPRGE